jgi:hypothetical protein
MVISFYLIQLEIKDTKNTDRCPAYIDLHLNQLRVRNSCVGSREVKCFNAIAGGDGSRLYVLLHIFIVLQKPHLIHTTLE